MFLNQRFISPIGHSYLQRRAAQWQGHRAFLRLAGYIRYICRHLVGIEPATLPFADGQEMHRHLEATLGIGHSLSRDTMSFRTPHAPIAIFQPHYLIAYLRSLHGCSGKGTCLPLHPDAIAGLIRNTYGVEHDLEGRTLVFLHAEGYASLLRFQVVETHPARHRQLNLSVEVSESIGGNLLLRHLLPHRICQQYRIACLFLHPQRVLQLTVSHARIVHLLPRTIDGTVGEHPHLVFRACHEALLYLREALPMDRHRFVFRCAGLAIHTAVAHALYPYLALSIGLVADLLGKAIAIALINAYHGMRHRMSALLVEHHQLLIVARKSPLHQEQGSDIHPYAMALLRVSVRFGHEEVDACLRDDYADRILAFAIIGGGRQTEMLLADERAVFRDVLHTDLREQRRFGRQVYPIKVQRESLQIPMSDREHYRCSGIDISRHQAQSRRKDFLLLVLQGTDAVVVRIATDRFAKQCQPFGRGILVHSHP